MRPIPSRAATAVAASAALLAAGLAVAPTATAVDLAPRSTFTMPVDETSGTVTLPDSGEGIPNVDSVKSTIRAYYNASGGLADRKSSPYITEVAGIEAKMLADFPALTGSDVGTKAIVLDTDDTLLWNYDYEDKGSNFIYNSATNAQWVTGSACNAANGTDFGAVKTGAYCFPAVPGMPETVMKLAQRGYKLYVITGRPASQETATIGNLTAAGFTDDGTADGTPLFDADNVFTKWETGASTYDATTVPDYIKTGQCTTFVDAAKTQYKCTTVEYKAQTRKHIEDAGVEIVGNVGDQLSDLWGGYADEAVKIPNPTYFLSSPDLDAAHRGADDQASTLVLPDTYTMAPDGSSGRTQKGDAIPNIDPVRTEIRAYYGATGGVANKTSSPYISELTSLESAWTPQIVTACQQGAAKVAAARTAARNTRAKVVADTKAVNKATRAVHQAKKKARRAHGSARKAARKRLKALTKALRKANARLTRDRRTAAGVTIPRSPAVVFDADDTTLWNYDLEDGAMGFSYTPATSAQWIKEQKFPAVPGMATLARAAKAAGCTIVGLTGRTADQEADTIANLTKVGFVDAAGQPLFTDANYYTKWVSTATPPAYLDCGDDRSCSTIEYKSGTREYLEEQQGLDIVANLGDQFSDLHGGYADKAYKVPNPTYYLP